VALKPEIKRLNQKKAKHNFFLGTVGILSLVYCLLTILPWSPEGNGFFLIDRSWADAVNIAFRDRLQFGRDFIYTYGLYGFIQVDSYFQENYTYFFVLRLLIALAVWAGLFKLIIHCLTAKSDRSWLFLIPVLGFLPNPVLSLNNLQFTVIIWPLVLYFYVSSNLNPVLVLTTVAMALGSLTKHTYLVPSLAFVILITVDEVFGQKRFPRILPLYVIAIAFFWILGGQNLANFPAYITNGLQIVKGFSASMGITGPLSEIILYLISTGLFWSLIAVTEWKNRRIRGLLPALGLAMLFFMSFKGSFVRHDYHATQATLNTTPVVLIFVAMLWSEIRRYSWKLSNKIKVTGILWCSVSLLLLFLMGSIIMHHYLGYGYGTYSFNLFQQPAMRFSEAIALITNKANLSEKSALETQNIKAQNLLPPISGTVDLYPNEVGIIFAYGLDYQPRPILQSFSAYTDKLAELNADHLKSSNAAETILFDINPIDEHLPSTEDGLSWLELLTRYDIRDLDSRYLVLKRNQQPRPYNLKPIQETNVSLGEWFEFPEAQSFPLWAKIKLDPNLIGKLTSAAVKLPAIYMEVETADGKQMKYRLIADILDRGFLISPLLSTRWDFLDFADSEWQERLKWERVKRIRILARGLNSLLYPDSYEISLSSFDFPRQDLQQVTGWQNWHSHRINKGTAIQPIDGGLVKMPLANGNFGWMAHAPTNIKVKLDDTAERLSFDFGIFDGAWQEGSTDGVEFRVTVRELDGQKKTIFSRRLEPVSNQKDRGIQQATIDLSQIETHEVILETSREKNHYWDWSFWSEITTYEGMRE
jgi:hypothetical protein